MPLRPTKNVGTFVVSVGQKAHLSFKIEAINRLTGDETLGVKTERGHIVTDPMCRTNVAGLWAIGDITALAHKVSHAR
jgi:thioredoxin reductase